MNLIINYQYIHPHTQTYMHACTLFSLHSYNMPNTYTNTNFENIERQDKVKDQGRKTQSPDTSHRTHYRNSLTWKKKKLKGKFHAVTGLIQVVPRVMMRLKLTACKRGNKMLQKEEGVPKGPLELQGP